MPHPEEGKSVTGAPRTSCLPDVTDLFLPPMTLSDGGPPCSRPGSAPFCGHRPRWRGGRSDGSGSRS